MAKRRQDKLQDLVGDVLRPRLPKEIVEGIMANVEKARMGVLNTFSAEVSKMLAGVDIQKIADEIAKNYKIKINAEIRFEPKDGAKKLEKSNRKR